MNGFLVTRPDPAFPQQAFARPEPSAESEPRAPEPRHQAPAGRFWPKAPGSFPGRTADGSRPGEWSWVNRSGPSGPDRALPGQVRFPSPAPNGRPCPLPDPRPAPDHRPERPGPAPRRPRPGRRWPPPTGPKGLSVFSWASLPIPARSRGHLAIMDNQAAIMDVDSWPKNRSWLALTFLHHRPIFHGGCVSPATFFVLFCNQF